MKNPSPANGVISYPESSRLDDHLFRVSLKAVILNEDSHVLVVKETGRDWWDIPGGGSNHGETVPEALARELYEEVSLEGNFEYEVILVEDPIHLATHNLYQMRITFVVVPESFTFKPGEDGDEVCFVNPQDFKDSELITERRIYEYCQVATRRA